MRLRSPFDDSQPLPSCWWSLPRSLPRCRSYRCRRGYLHLPGLIWAVLMLLLKDEFPRFLNHFSPLLLVYTFLLLQIAIWTSSYPLTFASPQLLSKPRQTTWCVSIYDHSGPFRRYGLSRFRNGDALFQWPPGGWLFSQFLVNRRFFPLFCQETSLPSLTPQAMDFAAVAHLAANRTSMPFMHFFDGEWPHPSYAPDWISNSYPPGFRTSHEVNTVKAIDYKDLAKIYDWDALREFRARGLNPEHPDTRGTIQSWEQQFQVRLLECSFSYPLLDILNGEIIGQIMEYPVTGVEHGSRPALRWRMCAYCRAGTCQARDHHRPVCGLRADAQGLESF